MGVWSLMILSLISFYYIHSSFASSHDVYIVYLGHNAVKDPKLTTRSHVRLLLNIFESEEEAMESMLYSYTCGFFGILRQAQPQPSTGFSRNGGSSISVREQSARVAHNRKLGGFMGLTLSSDAAVPSFPHVYGDDVIVGILDTGIWPESKSFKEEPAMRPVPSSWKGKCVVGNGFNPKVSCNRKLIGEKYYVAGFEVLCNNPKRKRNMII